MRKIEEQMVEAISKRESFHMDNTEVDFSDFTNVTVHLFGNKIATIDYKHRQLGITHAGWKTPTTKSRLNAILGHFGLDRISQSKGIWYIGEKEFMGAELLNF